MLVETYLYVLINAIFSANVVLGTLENSFVKQRTDDLACGNSSTPIELGTVGNVIACSRICSSTSGCRGFYFNEANGACWGSNQTECQAVANTVFYRKESHGNQQTNTTTNQDCSSGSNCTSPTDCGSPASITNTDVSVGGTLDGDTRTYTCLLAYVPRNTVTMETTCQPDGTWSTPSFDCMWDCGTPPNVFNAFVSGGDTVEGTTRAYTCNAGYAVMGTATITCQAGTTWSAVAFSCVADCGSPASITNTDVSVGGTLDGDTRTYTCLLAYVPRNTVTMETTCQPDGTWSTPSFDCMWDCGTPPNVFNAFVSGGDTVEGTTRAYTCNAGYAVMGTATITCQAGTTWSAVAFSCVADCGSPASITNTDVSVGGTLDGDTRTYTCLLAYVPRNTVTMETTCQPDGTWSTPSFDCMWDCGTPPNVFNAFVSGGDTVEGTTRAYTCNAGYAVMGTATITCQAGTTWSAVAFSCVADCGAPPAIVNADISSGGTLEGDTRTYTCSPGYVLVNVVTLDTTCQPDGAWTVESIDCLFDCGSPPSMAFATVSSGVSVTGSTRTYTCDSGYSTSGSATITCVDGSGWSAPTSTCTLLGCDAGWHMIGLSCYFIPGDGTSYGVFDARDICHSYNAYLVQLETETESNAVESWFFSTYPGVSVWIGLTDDATEGVWIWMNSSVPATWTNWNLPNSQPDGGSSDNYARLRTTGDWGDISWDSEREPLCEKSAE